MGRTRIPSHPSGHAVRIGDSTGNAAKTNAPANKDGAKFNRILYVDYSG
jgi:hypothetical protein